MKADFAILVCCLVALLSESRADRLPEVDESPLHYKMCYEELKLNRDRRYEDFTPEERKRHECVLMCVLKKRGYLQDGDDIFDEKIYLNHAPEDTPQAEKEKAVKRINDCKNKESGNPCRFINCISEKF